MNQVVAEKLRDFIDDGIPEAFERDLPLGRVAPPARGNLATVVTDMLVAFSPAPALDEGQRLETAVFCRLRRAAGGMRPCGLSRLLVDDGRHEADFVSGDALLGGGSELVQATVSLADPATRRREVEGIRAGMRALGEREGRIVTLDEQEKLDVPEGAVHIVPAWRWLLG